MTRFSIAASFSALLLAYAAAAPVSEFIYDSAPFPSCHASTIVEAAPGEFLAAWFGGTAEAAPDVAIWGARWKDGHWSEPVELAREPQVATFNPVLFYSGDGVLWLYYKFGPKPDRWTGARRFSHDAGKTWSPVEHLPAGLYGPIKDKPLVLPGGVIVSGTSVESYHSWASWVERSEDNGRTWTRHGPIIYPGEEYASIQPAVVRLRDGTLRMFVRTTHRIGRICSADSKDGGKTWTSLKTTSLPNPDSGIDAVTLNDGRIAIAYNHTTNGRTPLNVAISENGNDWQPAITLESDPGEFSYPAVIQASDGAVHVTYTWNRKKIKHIRIPLAELNGR